ncbi:hypothetical protein [Paraburkholderia aromaticivorans]|uniref:hypothetical protein n=1 Tax=Paraburkholderia aromaticivorans TaxID=2026199 RepID=UPI0038BB5AFF
MDYFNNMERLTALKERLAKVGLRIEANNQEGLTTYHLVRVDPTASKLKQVLGFDYITTLATDTTTAGLSRQIDQLLPHEEMAHEFHQMLVKIAASTKMDCHI